MWKFVVWNTNTVIILDITWTPPVQMPVVWGTAPASVFMRTVMMCAQSSCSCSEGAPPPLHGIG